MNVDASLHSPRYTLHGGDSRLSVRLNADASLHPTLYTLHGGNSRLSVRQNEWLRMPPYTLFPTPYTAAKPPYTPSTAAIAA